MEPPQELDFRDNSLNFDDDNKFSFGDDGKTNVGYENNGGLSLTVLLIQYPYLKPHLIACRGLPTASAVHAPQRQLFESANAFPLRWPAADAGYVSQCIAEFGSSVVQELTKSVGELFQSWNDKEATIAGEHEHIPKLPKGAELISAAVQLRSLLQPAPLATGFGICPAAAQLGE